MFNFSSRRKQWEPDVGGARTQELFCSIVQDKPLGRSFSTEEGLDQSRRNLSVDDRIEPKGAYFVRL